MPRKKKSLKKSSNNSLRFALIFAGLAVLGYVGISFAVGQGPLSFLATDSSVNLIMAPADSTPPPTQTQTNIEIARDEVIEKKKITYEQKPPVIKPPTITTTSTTCPGGNGTTIPVGMWVASGAALGDGRACVQCLDTGRYDNTNIELCSVVFANNPTNVILPNNPDSVYSGNTDQPLLNNCYRGSTLYPNGAKNGDNWCYGGAWVNKTEFLASMKFECGRDDREYVGDKCQAKPPETPPATEEPAVPAEPESTADNNQAYAEICEEQKTKYNQPRSVRWVECTQNSTGGTTMTYRTCSSPGFDNEGNCTTHTDSDSNYMFGQEESVEESLYEQSGTPFDSSNFTPPGSKALSLNDCAFGYDYGDNDKIICTERGDLNADQTQAQKDRSEIRDSLADEPANDFAQSLYGDPAYNNDQLTSKDLDEDAKTQSFFGVVGLWFKNTFYNNTWLDSEDLSDYDSEKPNDLINAIGSTENNNEELDFADTENQNFFESVRLWFQKTFSDDTQSELDGFDPDKPNAFIDQLDKNTNFNPLPTSTFTPPGTKVNDRNDCEFRYTTDDFNRIICAERGDQNAAQTAEQKTRSDNQ